MQCPLSVYTNTIYCFQFQSTACLTRGQIGQSAARHVVRAHSRGTEHVKDLITTAKTARETTPIPKIATLISVQVETKSDYFCRIDQIKNVHGVFLCICFPRSGWCFHGMVGLD